MRTLLDWWRNRRDPFEGLQAYDLEGNPVDEDDSPEEDEMSTDLRHAVVDAARFGPIEGSKITHARRERELQQQRDELQRRILQWAQAAVWVGVVGIIVTLILALLSRG